MVVLVAAAPLMIAIAAAVVLSGCGSPFFRQHRIGRAEKPFVLYKFRTMTEQRDERGRLLPDERRLTRFGRLLRCTSLDELPQLWNVVRGEMNLVGPRPLLPEYLPYYSARQRRRHEVKPGITGWAQINGRNGIGWERRLELDVWYVEHRTFGLDCRIVLATAGALVRRRGISASGHATMPSFIDSARGGCP